MAPSFQIVNDTITPHGGSYDDLTPHESNVRNAMFFITLLAPIFLSLIVLLFSARGWSYFNTWSFPRLAIFWFLSVGAFGVFVFSQKGVTDRTTFMFAVFHTQIEILINALLLKFNMRMAFIFAAIWGIVLYTATIASPTMTWVFFAGAILGGANDLLIFLLLAYGRKWYYAAGALFHVLSAVAVFADSVIFFDVVLYNVVIFLALWLHLVFTTGAIIQDSNLKAEYIELPTSPDLRNGRDSDVDSHNPLAHVTVSTPVLLFMIGLSLVESTAVTVLLYIFA